VTGLSPERESTRDVCEWQQNKLIFYKWNMRRLFNMQSSSTISLGYDNGGSAQSSQRCGRCPASIFVGCHQDAGIECILKKMLRGKLF
jgi:hypothetical protein